jgi:hypothetical protein
MDDLGRETQSLSPERIIASKMIGQIIPKKKKDRSKFIETL